MENQNLEPRPGNPEAQQPLPEESQIPMKDIPEEFPEASSQELPEEAAAEPKGEAWVDALFEEKLQEEELGPDELAVAEAGLVHPKDAELEAILQEAKELPQEDTGATQLFTPVNVEELLQAQAELPPEEDPEEEADEEDYEDDEAPEEAPLRKRRPGLKKGYGLLGIPHILATGVWLAIILAAGLYLGRIVWLCTTDVLALGKKPEKVTVVVADDDNIETIAEKLRIAGMIRYPKLFQKFAELTGKGEKIEPGTYTFNQKLGSDPDFEGIAYDYNALVMSMRHYGGAQDSVEILFPEGYNCAQIFALLEEKGVCTVKELEEYAANGQLDDYWFLENVERGHKYSLEGYLCADTYQFYIDDEPKRVLEKFLDEFDDRYTERLHQKFLELNEMLARKMAANGYDSAYIEEHQLTLHDVVVVASIVEKETAGNLESFDLAAIFYNRLTDPKDYPYLDSKATMKYAEEYYYKGMLHTTAAKEACEFNTHTQAGLPAKPICNPSLNSMAAALSPKDTNYFYFVYDQDSGSHRFAETESAYNAIRKELGLDG